MKILHTKTDLIIASFFLAGLFVLALGAGLFFFKNQQSEEIQIISTAQDEGNPGQAGEVVIDIGGAVLAPGVYKLAGNLRIGDAISAAGGLAEGADTTKMNLAAKISDGQKIYIPTREESIKGITSTTGIKGLININSASEQELDTLPGIGPATAKKIIASRPYSSLDDLVSKKAVSASVYEKIKDLISY